MPSSFRDFPLQLLNPAFDSDLVDVLTELEKLRDLRLRSDVHPDIFSQLKDIFHMLESLGSARIEGNHTTLADYVEERLTQSSSPSEQIDEIRNIEEAMCYIEETIQQGSWISERFICELHAMTVCGLKREGDKTPGQYRNHSVSIAQSLHHPPDALHVPTYMDELVGFINRDDKPKYDLMKVAQAHHRFNWIHPFGNGNGRTVRLLTYALLIKYGFGVQKGGRLLNPTAIFCIDRNRYYDMLATADKGAPEALEQWCCYVLSGISKELQKLDQLTQSHFLNHSILLPALAFAKERRLITQDEEKILAHVVKQGNIKAGDLEALFPELSESQRTYRIKKLSEKKFIIPQKQNKRIYIPNFMNSDLLRGVIKALRVQGFIGGLD